jgi:hypothetical protein
MLNYSTCLCTAAALPCRFESEVAPALQAEQELARELGHVAT